jgi:hypothetical protein
MKTIRHILLLIFILGALSLKAGYPQAVLGSDTKAPLPEGMVPALAPDFPREAPFTDAPVLPEITSGKSFVIRVRLIVPEVSIPDEPAVAEDYSYLAPVVPLEADFE